MTIEQIFEGVQGPFGALLILLIVAALFFRGSLVNGGIARQARQDALDQMSKNCESRDLLWRQRYDEMQGTWKDRCSELERERDYYRTFAFSTAQQTEQALAIARDKLPHL